MTVARPTRILLTGVAACVVIGLAAGPALAAATWTIKPGGAVTLALARVATIKDTKSGNLITCSSGNMSAALKSGSGLAGASAGRIAGGAVDKCEDGGPLPWRITLLGLPWHINLVSYDGSTGLVHGTISHLEISAASTGCGFVVDGTRGGTSDGRVGFTYSDRTHQLQSSGGNLHIFNVDGCGGLVAGGDPGSLTASLTLSPAQSITSP